MLRRIESATTIDECLWAEAGAAAYYFRSWEGHVAARFVSKDADSVPEHWRTFGSRSSHITAAPRAATDPVNAILNYLYALLLAETRVALLTASNASSFRRRSHWASRIPVRIFD